MPRESVGTKRNRIVAKSAEDVVAQLTNAMVHNGITQEKVQTVCGIKSRATYKSRKDNPKTFRLDEIILAGQLAGLDSITINLK